MKAHVIENAVIVNSIEVATLLDRPNLVNGDFGSIGWAFIDGAAIAPNDTPKAESELSKEARSKRNSLIAGTDYYALSDVVMTTEMTAYRQALRAIPEQEGFPNTITWPTAL